MGVINRATLDDIRKLGGAKLLAELIDLFLGESTPQVALLRKALERRDATELERAVHKLKGSSGNLGAMAMSALCADLQVRAKASDWPAAEPLVAKIEREYVTVRAELESEKGR